ncbi:NERD domain-containing protein [Pseudactinotalea sp. Z1748]|uniref:NERD domain-containing protein n=1 Tax=Pseudactinotalea sp. Z1748 TaxID=3413027 RepID=UPI003C799652
MSPTTFMPRCNAKRRNAAQRGQSLQQYLAAELRHPAERRSIDEVLGLKHIREFLPNQSPYRAWSNFEFRDGRGRSHEVDLLVLAKDQLHLIELKYYSGILRSDDHANYAVGNPPRTPPALTASATTARRIRVCLR